MPDRPKQVSMQTVQIQMRRLVTSHLIKTCTVCHSDFGFRLKPLFSVDISKAKMEELTSETQG